MNAKNIGGKLDQILDMLKSGRSGSETPAPSNSAATSKRLRALSPSDWIQLGISLLTFAGLIFTARSYKLSRNGLFQTQRAFLNPTGPNTEPLRQGPHEFARVNVGWENTGTTPAPVAITYIHYDRFSDADSRSWKFPIPKEDNFRKSYAGPHTPLSTQSVQIPEEQYLQQQNTVLTVWGWMVYRDVIPGSSKHLTEFCYSETELDQKPDSIVDDKGNRILHLQSVWRLCDLHNCVDEYCEDYKGVVKKLED